MANFVNLFFVIVLVTSFCNAYLVDNNPYRHRVTLDPRGKYQLEWMVNWESREITFNVTVNTRGYVGFGLSRKGKMTGADLIIGGVYPGGTTYFSDRHAIGNQLPREDPSQDWTLHTAWERNNQTFLSFSRPFDTCDEDHDLPITNDLLSIIWAYSEADDEIQYHFQNKGSYDAYLLDPDLVPRGIEDFSRGTKVAQNVSVYKMEPKMQLREQDTLYYCTFHKLSTTKKQHVIGFNTVFPTEKDRRHVHHLLLHRCRAPPGQDPEEFFEGAVKSGGNDCYVSDGQNPLPTSYCRETIHMWGVGGRAIFFPDHVGLPISHDDKDQYLMLQVHYDNPNLVTNETVTVSLELYHTENLRKNDAGLLMLGVMQPGFTSILIPPSDPNHVIMGHCAPGCTERMLGPGGGANVFAVLFHTHLAGRGARALHFRNGKELPWIAEDDNYNFNYQQFRVLRQERRVLPGDQLITRCVFDSTDRNGSVITGGFSTREEMCTSFLYYYSRAPGFSLCRGSVLTDKYFDFLGIGRNLTWNQNIRHTQVTSPAQFAGMSWQDYADTQINWNLESRKELQKLHIFEPQSTQCPRFFFENPQTQLEYQVKNLFPRTGRLPGSDGKVYTSVDENYIYESEYPRNGKRWTPEPQCSKRRQSGVDEHSL